MNKNEVIVQFSNKDILSAISTLCTENEVNLGYVAKFNKKITKIYKDVIFADVLKNLLNIEKTKGGLTDVYIDCKNGQLNIIPYQLEQNLTSIIANNMIISSDMTYSNITTKKSLQDLRNRVIFSDNNDKSLRKAERSNSNSISIYGLLTAVETVDTDKNNNLKELAEKKLDELNKITEEQSLSLLGDYRVSKGKLVDLNIREYGLNGRYLIKNANHTISNKEIVSITIEKINL